jgi:acyl transferase domain-containing protein
MQQLAARGAMAAVFADEPTVQAAIEHAGRAVSIAALNGPGHIVISGAANDVDAVIAALEPSGARVTRLTVSHAFHSQLVEPMLEAFERIAREVAFAPPRVPVISNLTGTTATGDEIMDPSYWRRHIREAVRFGDGIQTAWNQSHRIFLEVGPSPTLLGMGRRAVPDEAALWLPSLRRGRGDWDQMLESLAALYAAGADLDWAGFERDYARQKVALPTYPFERQRHWVSVGAPGLQERLSAQKTSAFDEVVEALSAGFREAHGLELTPGGLTEAEEALMQRLIREKYGTAAWTRSGQAVTDLSSVAPAR